MTGKNYLESGIMLERNVKLKVSQISYLKNIMSNYGDFFAKYQAEIDSLEKELNEISDKMIVFLKVYYKVISVFEKERDVEICHKRYIEGISPTEIAKRMFIDRKTVYRTLWTAEKACAELMKNENASRSN